MRFARLDLRARPGRPPPRPKAPWVPPRPPGPPRKPPPPPPGRPPKPPPAPGPPPGRAPAAPGRAPPRAGRSPGRATAERSGIMPGLGRAPPGRGPAGTAGAAGPTGTAGTGARTALRTRHPLAGGERVVAGSCRRLAGAAHALALRERVVARARGRRARSTRTRGTLAGATLTGGRGHRCGRRGRGRRRGGCRCGGSGGGRSRCCRCRSGGRRSRRRGGRRRRCGRARGRGGAAGAAAAGAGAAGAAAGGAAAAGAGAAGAAGALAAGAAGAAAAFLAGAAAGAAAGGASVGNFSLYLRTTGVSIVELALLTYSPMPFRRSRRTLLVTPSSLASALTRTLDTSLLSRSVLCCADRRYSWGVLIAEYSSGAHQRQTRFRFLLSDGGSCGCASTQSVTAEWSGGVLLRSARPNARRRTASSRHERTGCSHAPRPCPRCSGSGRTTGMPSAPGPRTTRRSADRLSAPRHPMQVRTGWPGRSPVRSVCTSLPPRGAGARHRRWSAPARSPRCRGGCRSASR